MGDIYNVGDFRLGKISYKAALVSGNASIRGPLFLALRTRTGHLRR
jgi:hypothetical protein